MEEEQQNPFAAVLGQALAQQQNQRLSATMRLNDLWEWAVNLGDEDSKQLSKLVDMMSADDTGKVANFWSGVLTMKRTEFGERPWGDSLVSDDALASLLEGSQNPLEGPESAS